MGKALACVTEAPWLLGKLFFSLADVIAATRSVTVEGGGANPYEISEYGGRYPPRTSEWAFCRISEPRLEAGRALRMRRC